MCNHETKSCPRCSLPFECKAGSVTQCHCFGVRLSEEERAVIEREYKDCLCNKCLMEVKEKHDEVQGHAEAGA